MALDLWLTTDPESLPDGEQLLQLGVGTEFWFLYPFFEAVAKETGQQIDPWGDARFSDIAVLERELLRARNQVKGLAKESYFSCWQNDAEKDVPDTLVRSDVETLIDSLLIAVSRAKAESKWLVFIGD
jgi:hypothetical protein